MGPRYEVGVEYDDGVGKLRIIDTNAGTITNTPFGAVGATLNLVLRMELSGSVVRASIGGNGATAEVMATLPNVTAPITFGFAAYRDPPRRNGFAIDFLHLRRIVPVN